MSIISTQHKIKNRSVANDVFITPRALAREHLQIVNKIFNWSVEDSYNQHHLLVIDPCRNNEDGSYFGQFGHLNPMCTSTRFEWYEEKEGRDFFTYGLEAFDNTDTILVGNPPFSMMDKWLQRSIKEKAQIISYLMPVYSLTAKRLEMMEKAGYYLVNMHQFKWYVCNGMCCFATWIENNERNCGDQPYVIKPFTFNRKVWYNVEKWEEKKKREMERQYKKEAKELKKVLRKKRLERERLKKAHKKLFKKCLKKINKMKKV